MKVFNTIRCLFLAGLLIVSGAETFAQNVTVKGKVTDSRGEPVIGATVMLSSNQTVGSSTSSWRKTRNSWKRPSSSVTASSARATSRAPSLP